MGNLNFDLSKEKRFKHITYACAAVGAAAAAITAPAAIPGGMVGYLVVGAIAGGIGLPIAAATVALGGIILFSAARELFKVAKKEGAALPLGIAIIGASSAKALFITPFSALRSVFNKKSAASKSAPAKKNTPANKPNSAAPK